MKILTGKTALLLLLTLVPVASPAQQIGFGCLGFVGGFVGYEINNYKAEGLNNYVDRYNEIRSDSLQSPLGEFGRATGFRVGLNITRQNIDGVIFTLKGFYHRLGDLKTATFTSGEGVATEEYDLRFRNYGIGIDIGTELNEYISWKILNLELVYHHATLVIKGTYPGRPATREELTSADEAFGVVIGSGFIWRIIGDYLSLEGSFGYSFLTLDSLEYEDGSLLPENEISTRPMNNLISEGGFNSVIQVNVGFPL